MIAGPGGCGVGWKREADSRGSAWSRRALREGDLLAMEAECGGGVDADIAFGRRCGRSAETDRTDVLAPRDGRAVHASALIRPGQCRRPSMSCGRSRAVRSRQDGDVISRPTTGRPHPSKRDPATPQQEGK